LNRIHAIIKPNVDKLFSLQPKQSLRSEEQRLLGKNGGVQNTVKSSRWISPWCVYVPIPDIKEYNMYGDEDLFFTEAIPGHHFQISLQQENKSLPDFRKYNGLEPMVKDGPIHREV
jgi:uncharacterized protein (DUF885 family)